MATYAPPVPLVSTRRAEAPARGWTSWITTTDHKRIGIMYMVTTFVFFVLGGVEALMMRLQLGAPDNTLVTPAVYNQLFTMHGTTMIFLFVVPFFAGLANYFVPLMIGARDMAFPRLNALSFWLLLWQHLFWFFGHPEVYIMILPGFGVVSEILPVFARKPIFGYRAIAAATVAIAFLGFLTWAHHMFTAPIPEAILVFVMLSSYFIAVPTGVKILNWIATLWRGTIEFKTPLLFCAGFIALFLIGGISGVFLATFPVDWQLKETYFLVAHLHFVLMGGSVFTIFAAIYYWFPKITGRMLSEGLGRLSFGLMFVGFLTTFLIQHVIGLDGMPRRVYEYDNVGHLHLYNVISTVGSFVLGLGVLVTIINVARSRKVGVVAGPDPWKANTPEG